MRISKRTFFLGGLIGASSLSTPLLAAAASSKSPQHTPVPRLSGSANDQERGTVAGNPDARFAADEVASYREALGTNPILGEAPWLALSTGGDSGAFGAGLLKGWSDAAALSRPISLQPSRANTLPVADCSSSRRIWIPVAPSLGTWEQSL